MKYPRLNGVIWLLALSAGTVSGQINVASTEVIMKEAVAKATDTHKNVFVIFTASWCGWCHKMDRSMNDLKSFFDNNYVVVHLTVDERDDKKQLENPGADQLRIKYHGEQQGLPYWFILDSKGKFLADSRLKPANSGANARATSIGCPATIEEVNYFVDVMRKTSSLNDSQLAMIHERFLKNKE